MSKLIVLKVGTSSLISVEKQRMLISNLAKIVETVKALTCMGEAPALVSAATPSSDLDSITHQAIRLS